MSTTNGNRNVAVDVPPTPSHRPTAAQEAAPESRLAADWQTVDEQAFREAIACFATGVTVITAAHEGEPIGMAANAVTSVSLNPTLLLACINSRLFTHETVERTGRFGVNVLGADHEHVARHFATSASDKFSSARFRWAHGVPVLEDAIAYFVCDVYERHPGGTHSLFIGRVRECGRLSDQHPLLFFRSRFGRIDDPASDEAKASATVSRLPSSEPNSARARPVHGQAAS